MYFDIYNTHMELYPYIKDQYPIIEDMYTATDKFSGRDFPCGYMIEDGKLYLPRGTSISKIESICDCKANYNTDSDPIKNMSHMFSALYDPRDKLQEESISFLRGDDHQLALNISMGRGKTYCTAYASTMLNVKTLIITPNEGIKRQWINTYKSMFTYRNQNLMNIAGSSIIECIMLDLMPEADIYFVNHQTLRSYISQHNGYELHSFFKKIGIGIKVYDESHMEFANILLIDNYSNTDRTWYLTATFDRSDKTESACFKRAFNSVITYGELESAESSRKHVIYHVVNIDSHISPKHRAWLMSNYQGFTATNYGKYAFQKDQNNTAYKAILSVLKKLEKVEGKILIFIPLIENVDSVTSKLKQDWSSKSVGAYHSKMSADEKESTLKKDIIVSTIKSCGTGKDIVGLRAVICCEPIASKVIAAQVFGRIRPYADDKDTYFFDICDICIPPINWWWRSRYKKIATLCKETIFLDIK